MREEQLLSLFSGFLSQPAKVKKKPAVTVYSPRRAAAAAWGSATLLPPEVGWWWVSPSA